MQSTSIRPTGVRVYTHYWWRTIKSNRKICLGNCVSADNVSDQINLRMVKARMAYANLSHLCCCHDVSIAIRGRVCKVDEGSFALSLENLSCTSLRC